MVARVLHGVGIFLGDRIDQVVFEDHEFAGTLDEAVLDLDRFKALVRDRNGRFPIWGFKRPHLHVHGALPVRLCRNPFVVLTVRDPVAIAARNVISEQRDSLLTLSAAIDDLQQMLHFANALDCPVMLISYEKAISRPEDFVTRLLEFCGLHLDDNGLAPLLALVEPDRPAYVENTCRIFDGYIDGIRSNRLFGWAWQRGHAAGDPYPVPRHGPRAGFRGQPAS